MEEQKSQRKRGMTSVALQWVNERLRKAELIKRKLAAGNYSVPAQEVARSLVGNDDKA